MTNLTIIIKGDDNTYSARQTLREYSAIYDKLKKIYVISAANLYKMTVGLNRSVGNFYGFEIENLSDWDKFLAEKKSEKEAEENKALQAKEEKQDAKLKEQAALVSEKINQFGADRVQADLLDACLNNKTKVAAVLANTHILNEKELKSFLNYCQ